MTDRPSTPTAPTWRDLFGSLDYKEADAGRSVYAPAAYLADLLRLLGDELNASHELNFDVLRFAAPELACVPRAPRPQTSEYIPKNAPEKMQCWARE